MLLELDATNTNMVIHVFNWDSLPLYFLGFCTFLITILDDWLSPKNKFKKIAWYIQDFLYTLISIALGISICYALELSQSISWIVSIFMGLCGSTLIRKIRNQKDEICDDIIEKISNKVSNNIDKKIDNISPNK